MANINMKQLKATVTMLKNYIDKKIEGISSGSGSGGTSTTTEVTKDYVDNKMIYDGYETILTVPAEDITNAEIKDDDDTYSLSATGSMELNTTDEYIIVYGGITYKAELIYDSESGITFEDGCLNTKDENKIAIINKFDLYTTNNNRCRITIHKANATDITDLLVKKKVSSNLKVLALTKADYDALETKDSSTLYIVTE